MFNRLFMFSRLAACAVLVFSIASLSHSQANAQDVVISEFMASNVTTAVPLDSSGQFYDWIELHNLSASPVDLSGWHLTDDKGIAFKWTFPSTTIPAGGYKIVMASGTNIPVAGLLHTNFSLSARGGYLALIRPDLSVASRYNDYPKQFGDVSYGIPGNGGAAIHLASATPGTANGNVEHLFVRDTQFSHKRGHYTTAFAVSLSSNTIGATIRYTTDGSEPTLSSNGSTYSSPINITTTTVLRARAFLSGYAPTNIDTQTYIFPEDITTQVRPSGYPTVWGGEPNADYEMDTTISESGLYHDRLIAGLSDIPTLSVATHRDNMFGTNGIYSKPTTDTLEVPVSAEYFQPTNLINGTNAEDGFQINCGFTIQGSGSRNPNNSIKHSFSLRFRALYGDGALDYKLFPESTVQEFNSLQLRAMFNNSWIHADSVQRARATMIRDQWIRDSLIAMGQDDGGHGNYVHLYINGLYWGVYNMHERLDNDHYAAYNGGDSNAIDALNPSTINIDTGLSTVTSYNDMVSVVQNGTWSDILEVLDVDSYIDYYIIEHFGHNRDLKEEGNWRAAGGGSSGALWRFYTWDSERVLEDVNSTGKLSKSQDGADIIAELGQHEEFRIRFADRAQKHLFNGGALTSPANLARWTKYSDLLDRAIIGESARWGDDRRSTPYTRDVEWIAAVNNIKNNFFKPTGNHRTSYVITKFRGNGNTDQEFATWPNGDHFLPDTVTPTFEVNNTPQHGGQILLTDDVGFSSVTGTIYYTTDGSDPRYSDYSEPTSILVAECDDCQYLVPTNGTLGNSWVNRLFDDSAWSTGATGLGFDKIDGSYQGYFNTDLSAQMTGANAANNSCYMRLSFNIPNQATLDAINTLSLDLKYEDAVVAWINGTKVFTSAFAPASPTYSSFASNKREPESTNIVFAPYDVSAGINGLVVGTNVLAIQLMNEVPSNTDLLCVPRLRYGPIPTGASGIASSATAYSSDFQLSSSATVKARTLHNSKWSALIEADFIVEPLAGAGDLIITEINYNPADPTQEELNAGLALLSPQLFDADYFEFIEFQNVAPYSINLIGVNFTNGITYTFGSVILAAGEHLVLARNLDAFHIRYGNLPSVQVISGYTGTLSNSGEKIGYATASAQAIQLIDYDDGGSWPGRADGGASTLEFVLGGDPTRGSDWRSSSEFNGSPGFAGAGPDNRIVINEVLAHTDLPEVDSIELYNTTSTPVDISHWYLSDTRDQYLRYQVPEGTIVPAYGYIVFDEYDFNSSGTGTAPDFALSAAQGDDVYLLSGNAAGYPLSFIDHVEFGASFNGVTLGRWPNGEGRLVPMISNTLNATNSGPIIGDVIISEVMYHPTDAQLYEYIELHNRSGSTVNLNNWSLRGGSDFDFTNAHQLAADAVLLLVGFDPADSITASAFRATYGISPSVTLLGPLVGSLDNSGDVIKLNRPDEPPAEDPTLYPQVLEDIVDFNDVSPWPLSADGVGDSLHRLTPTAYGSFFSSWQAGFPGGGSGVYDPDQDGDGIHELLEYALNLDPNTPDADAMPVPVIDNNNLIYTYPKDMSKLDISYQLEGSINLQSWAPLSDTLSSTAGSIQMREVSVPVADSYFIRLRVTR